MIAAGTFRYPAQTLARDEAPGRRAPAGLPDYHRRAPTCAAKEVDRVHVAHADAT